MLEETPTPKILRKATYEDFFGVPERKSNRKSNICEKDTDYQRQINEEFGHKKFIKP